MAKQKKEITNEQTADVVKLEDSKPIEPVSEESLPTQETPDTLAVKQSTYNPDTEFVVNKKLFCEMVVAVTRNQAQQYRSQAGLINFGLMLGVQDYDGQVAKYEEIEKYFYENSI